VLSACLSRSCSRESDRPCSAGSSGTVSDTGRVCPGIRNRPAGGTASQLVGGALVRAICQKYSGDVHQDRHGENRLEEVPANLPRSGAIVGNAESMVMQMPATDVLAFLAALAAGKNPSHLPMPSRLSMHRHRRTSMARRSAVPRESRDDRDQTPGLPGHEPRQHFPHPATDATGENVDRRQLRI